MATKTILFGAGGAGQSYYNLHHETKTIIAFFDSDVRLHGTVCRGLPVLAPSAPNMMMFDEVVITSMWVREIAQILGELGVPGHKVVVPPKNQLKNGLPFEDSGTRLFAEATLVDLTTSLAELGTDIFVDLGTLLGVARDGQILEWDDDIDMSIPDTQFEGLENAWLEACESLATDANSEWLSSKVHDGLGNAQGLTLDFQPGVKSALNGFGLMVRCRRTEADLSIPTGAVGVLDIPKWHFESGDLLPLRSGGTVLGPVGHARYLERVYGDWLTPRRELSFTDYAGIDPRSFGPIDPKKLFSERIF